MRSKKKDIEILSFSIPRKLGQELEELTKEIGYSNRSELIRDAIRLLKKSSVKIDRLTGRVEGVIISLYDHSAETDVSDIRHKNMEIIKSFMHTDFNEKTKTCCDVLIFSGKSDQVKGLAFSLEAVKNVNEVKMFLA
jgi:CopG family nickel-responsive transcriptional regulator